MKKILPVVFLFACSVAHGQVKFQKTFGGASTDAARCLRPTSGAGYLLAGQTFSYGAGQSDCFLVSTNSNGDTLWTVVIGTSYDERISSVQQTSDGGYIFAGTINALVAANDYYVARVSSAGVPVWIKSYGGDEDDVEAFVLPTNDGGFIVTGVTASYDGDAVHPDIAYIKLDGAGNILSSHVIDVNPADKIYDFQNTADGGSILLGDAIELIKLDFSGSVIWSRNIISANTLKGTSVKQSPDGGYIITGSINNSVSGTGRDLLLVKTDTTGHVLWNKAYGGTGDDEGVSISLAADGGYVISGWTLSFGAGSADGYLIKTNAAGNILWTKVYGGTGNDQLNSIIQTTDGGYSISGLTTSNGAGSADCYFIKTDANGSSGCNEGGASTVVSSPVITDSAITAAVYPFAFDATSFASSTTRGCQRFNLCSVIGIDDIEEDNTFSISPNPFTTHLTITSNLKPETAIILFDITGKAIVTAKASNGVTTLNTEGIAAGLYFVRVESDRGVSNYKVVKE